MKKETKLGMNRTGIAMSPMDSAELIQGVEQSSPNPPGSFEAMKNERKRYIREATPVGSVPLPGTMRGAATTGAEKLMGKNPEVLINKLGERLAFERTGVRLYDALITKCEEKAGEGGPIPLETLRRFREEELKHFEAVRDVMLTIGADPTAMTPDADASGVAAMGLIQLITDPRTTVAQCLQGILMAELADNDCWQLLIQLTEDAGLAPAAEIFRDALREEGMHLVEVRNWLQALVLVEAGSSRVQAA